MILPHFERLLAICDVRGWQEGHTTLTVKREGLVAILKEMLRTAPFDEQWYLERYPDVAEALETKELPSAREHYVQFGYFEGRLPGLNGFDPEAYCRGYPDLEHLLSLPEGVSDATAHFIENGYREGRIAPERAAS
jgi:hypothetical protein